jgi:hypothetical protein
VIRSSCCSAVLGIGLLAGCSALVAGHPVRTPVNAAERALPSSFELRRILDLPIETDSLPQVGAMDALRDDENAISPAQCAGVTHAGYRLTYYGAAVRSVARGFWATSPGNDDRVNVVVSVVELDSPRGARSWYTKTAARWAQCQGVTVTEHTNAVSFLQHIGRISDVDQTLTTELLVTTDNGIMMPGLNRRAFTASSRYLVDTEVFGTPAGSGNSRFDAGEIAHQTAAKLR